jgi:hypothetical protein
MRLGEKRLAIGVSVVVITSVVLTMSLFLMSRGANSRVQAIRTSNASALDTNAGSPSANGPHSYSDAEIAQMFLHDGDFITQVTHVAVKRTTWADFLPYSGRTRLPSNMSLSDVIDVVVQAGTVHPGAWGQGAGGPNPNGYQYAWVANVVYPNNFPGPSITWDAPGSAWPTWFAKVPGAETDAHN